MNLARPFRHLPVKLKLTLILTVTGTVALVLACVSLGVVEGFEKRRALRQEASVTATLLGGNSAAALVFQDAELGAEILGVLRADPMVLAAALYTPDGELLTAYQAQGRGRPVPARPGLHGEVFGDGCLEIVRSVESRGNYAGSIYMCYSTEGITAGVRRFAWIACVVLAVSAAGTLLLSTRLQALVSRPILNLSAVARRVSREGDYSLRAPKTTEDEVGTLIDTFNGMLSVIQARDEDLRSAMTRAEAATVAKSRFLAMMSHEIRTPLNGVIGMTALLQETRLDEEQREFAETVRFSATSLLQIINDILDFSKIEAGKLELEETPCCLIAVVEEALDMVVQQADAKGLELHCRLGPGLPDSASLDPVRLRQVLLNLLGNGVKFTAKGHVAVDVDFEPAGDARGTLRIAVEDTGIGIPAERMDRLFESFSQVDASTTRKHGGTGLGLAISRMLVERMGGTIEVESRLGQGATFSFGIPLQSVAFGPAEHDLQGARVAVLTRSAGARSTFERVLASWGCEVVHLSRARDAAQRLAAGEAQALVADHGLLGEVGGATGVDPRAVIALARLGELTRVRAGCRAAGMACLATPVKPSQLRAALTAIVHPERETPVQIAPVPASAETGAAVERARVLVVEDEPANRDYVLRALSTLPVVCDVAADGAEALRLFRAGSYAMILMDVMMPKVDGLETTRRMRALEAVAGEAAGVEQRVPILGLSAKALAGDPQECLDAGMDDFLAKPVLPGDLRDAVRRWALSVGEREAQPAPALRILVVEDNPVNQRLLARALAKEGYEVALARNGVEALEVFQGEAFAAVLMDVMMPEMDGLEATRRLRQGGQRVPIIGVSANTTVEDRRLAEEAGMNDYLPKPVRLPELHKLLRHWLAERPDRDAA